MAVATIDPPPWQPRSVLGDAELAELAESLREHGLVQLKGHRLVGGMRASIYNAMPLEGVRALVDFMLDFERRHG